MKHIINFEVIWTETDTYVYRLFVYDDELQTMTVVEIPMLLQQTDSGEIWQPKLN